MNKFHLPKFYLLIVLMMISVSSALAQGYNTTNWKFSNPKQFGFTVLDVDYFDNNNAIAVGSNGGIAKTTDGGLNWTYGVYTYINPTGFKVTANFNDVHYITSTVAYAVGNNGAMVKTTDGGTTWNFVTNPLLPNQKIINACWFVDANKGYIGGDYNNTPDSLPKLYVTLNGGSTWDSIAAPPVNGVSRVGYINNPNIPSVLAPVDAKLKSIYRIEFINDSTGYVCGSNSYGVSLFPPVSFRATSTTVCAPLATLLTSGSMAASLLWKFKSGILTDYSLSKERLGYTGINTNTINCTAAFATITPVTQQYRAMNIVNDSTVVLMSFNNNTVVKVNTGKNDSTANVNAPGIFEKGKYEILNFPSPPSQGPNAGPAIPPVQVLLASNPYQMKRTSAGTLVVNGNFGRMFKSVDTGRNWVQDISLPQGQNFSSDGVWAMDIAPNGRFLSMGNNGVTADSMPGSPWHSNYSAIPYSAGYSDMEFTDCNNGIAAGGSSITVTTDGGNTWIDKNNAVLGALFANITSVTYPNPAKVYFTTNIGNIYRSTNQGTTISPVFGEPLSLVNDLAAIGADSLWACGATSSSVPSASRQGLVFRSFDNGTNWDTVRVGPVGNATYITFKGIEFPTRDIGYIAGNRGAVYKTTDGGATWTNVSPTPLLIASMSFSDIQALNKDTVFVIGQGFPIKVVYRTTDGGATWTDITSNITALGVGNLNGILMHDINNGYVMTPGGALLITNDGGATWSLDLAPTGNLFTTAAFVPKTVGPGVSMVNRKMFVSGPNISGAPMMEYGNPANTHVNSTELISGAACSTPNGGSITVTASGGLAPYTYSLDGGPFQPSNVFNGLTAGNHTLVIQDAYCGLLTKTVVVGLTDDFVLNTNITTAAVCAGVPVQLIASGNAATYSWSPATGLSNPNIANPIATPLVTTTYTVTATLNSCVKTKDITITITPNPAIVILADPGTTLCEGDPTLLTVRLGSSTPIGTLYTQGTTPVDGSPSQVFEPANTAFNSQSADDFTVPSGTTWTVTRVNAVGIGTGTPTSVNVFFYNNSGANLPGSVVASYNNITTYTQAGGTYNVTLPTSLILAPGTYWVSVQVNMSFATGGQWFWGNYGTTNVGNQYAWQNPGGGFGTPCSGWGYGATGCGVGGGVNRNNIFTIIGSSLADGGPLPGGYTFLWSPAAGLSSTTSNPVAASPMNTTLYTVNVNTGTGCTNQASILITVNKRPTVTVQPVSQVNCSGTTATFTVGGTGTGLTYQWQQSVTGVGGPWTNLTNIAPYGGATGPVLTINPVSGVMNGYAYRCVLSGTCAAIGTANISNAVLLTVNPLPNVSITPPVSCGGVAGIYGTQLSVNSSAPPIPGNVSASSGAISVVIPDGTGVAAISTLNIAGVPANATITQVKITMNMNHTWVGDVDVNIKSPNAAILNLVGGLDGGTGGNSSDNFTNTAFSSLGGATISGAAAPRTGTYAAEARVGYGPTGYIQAAPATWGGLTPTATSANGVWTLAMGDWAGGDQGTLTSWSISIDYTTPGSGGGPTLTYVWSPLAGLYNNSTATVAYTGTNTPTVYAAPTAQTVYTVTATDVATGCVGTATALVNYTPPAPTITPSSVTMCLGDPAVMLKSSSSQAYSATFNSGAMSLAIPDGPATWPQTLFPGVSTPNLPVSGIPANATITGMSVKLNLTHTYIADMVIVLKAPNGAVLNLDANISRTGGAGANFVNTIISSASSTALSAGAPPYTGTFKPDAVGATYTAVGFTFPGGPTTPAGYIPTVSSFSGLYSVPNGNWTLGIYDWGAGDLGTLTNWELKIDYIIGVPATPAVWTPAAGLYSNASATTPYVAGTAVDSVWTRPTPSGVYNYQATVQNIITNNSTIATPMAGGNGNNLVAFNVRNNNATPINFNSISSNTFGSGAVVSRVFYKAAPIAGNPGPISAANGWIQFGTANNTVTAGSLNLLMSGLTLSIPAGATYGIALDMTGATFPAYTNGTGTIQTYSNNNVDLITDGNVGWGGPAAPGTPANNPRNFNGSIDLGGSGPGTCTSPARTVVVTVKDPTTVVTQPVNQTICTDKVATFTVAGGGSGPFSYQWQVSTNGGNPPWTNVANGGVYSGATSATLTITAPPVSMSGYQYRCVITGAAPCAAATSFSRILTVNPLPVVVISASPYTSLLPGLVTTLSSTVSPNAAASYSWLHDGASVPGANTGSLSVDVDGLGDYQLSVIDVNGCTSSSNIIKIKDSASGKCFIYPNPTNGQFQVRYYSVANNVLPRSLTVYDAKGDRVFTKFYTVGRPYDRMDVDMRAYGKGLYWVEIGDLNGNRITMCRVVIQ